MGNIVQMTGQEVGEAISIYGQAVAGQSAAETAAALGATSNATVGGNNVLSFPMQSTQGGKPISVEAQYAGQLWDYYRTLGIVGGTTTALGAAAAGAKAWATGVFIGDATAAGSLAGTGALITMSLPAVAAAAAPMLGVALGDVLYSSNPELWTKISQTLLPWCYEDTEVMGAVVTDSGLVTIPKGAMDALKALFEDEGIISDVSYCTNPDYPNIPQPIPVHQTFVYNYKLPSWPENNNIVSVSSGVLVVQKKSNTTADLYGFSKTPGNLVITTTKYPEQVMTYTYQGPITSTGGNPFYFDNVGVSNITEFVSADPWETGNVIYSIADLADIVLYGTSVAGNYPVGTSAFPVAAPEYSSLPLTKVVSSAAGDLVDYIPVVIPEYVPQVTGDVWNPTVSPTEVTQLPQTVELPWLDPWISPQTSPAQWPESLPDLDPSQERAPQIAIDPTTVPQPNLDPSINPALDPVPGTEYLPQETIPQSAGNSPDILFPVPDVPFPSPIPASGPGLIHVYNPTPSQLTSFGRWLWVTWADTSIDAIQKIWNDPFDGVISAHELYATPSNDGTDTIKSGFLDSGINSTIVRQRYTSINCGSILIPEFYGNYLDYSPYSKAYIYLPFIGIVEVNVDDIVGHSINILYHIDSYNGSCIAQVTVARDDYINTVYQFSGNCAVELPLAGGSQAAIKAALVGAAANTLGGVVTGSPARAVGGLTSGFANVVSQKSTVQHSGTFGASYGAMGIKKPYIIIRRPVEKEVNLYNNDYGYPAHKRVIIGDCQGYLRVREVNVQSTLATDEEKAQIETLLKAGVYIT